MESHTNSMENDINLLTKALHTISLEKDISGKSHEELNIAYESSIVKKWIKLIPISKTTSFLEYNRKEYFIQVANITLDKDVHEKGKKHGQKKRNTLIKFTPIINETDYNAITEWLYLLVINRQIVKIGGTRTGLKERANSYLCGHHVQERGKSGDCSKTNGYIYNTFEFYLSLGCKILMYGYRLPKVEIPIKIFDNDVKIIAQTYHAYESSFISDYKCQYNEYPILCDNCDPNYSSLA